MQLEAVVPWGRNLSEYQQMFGLTTADYNCRILGCGDGPASFNAEMQTLGHRVVSIDPIYQFSADQIRQRVEATYESIIAQVTAQPGDYIWKTFENPLALGRSRLATMEQFLADYDRGRQAQRYQAAALPQLPFEPQAFDLALCSHLLFLYSAQLTREFHISAIQALLRVSREIRIFPLLTLDQQPSPYLEPVLNMLTDQGHQTEIITVAYEFQQGANQMLRIQTRN